MAYSVEEVGELLDIPRPTLYRYLREYSIPHVRSSGRIFIPEESFDRIREARELHREGMGTGAVRRKLREGPVDVEGLKERLDRLFGNLEELQEGLKLTSTALSPQTLQTLLARQALLSSALCDLIEMLGGDQRNGHRRKAGFGALEEELQAQRAMLERVERRIESVECALDANTSAIEDFSRSAESISEMTKYVVSVASLLKNDILLSSASKQPNGA